MAIIKHNSSKTAKYTDVLEYYSFKHTEDVNTGHYEPVLDEYGLIQERENYTVAYIAASGREDDPQNWAAACMRTNLAFGKNGNYEDVKNHEYIISHPAEDRPRMTMEDLLEEGKAFVRDNLQGYDALIAVHRDTDNDHIHITINSVRAMARQEQPWMIKNAAGETKLCEMAAGNKHQDSAAFRLHCNDWLLEYTRQHGLTVKDNNAIAEARKNAWFQQWDTPAAPGKKLTRHERELRSALLSARRFCDSLPELRDTLMADFGVTLIQRGQTFSLLHPEMEKPVRLRTLGIVADILSFDDSLDQADISGDGPAPGAAAPARDGAAEDQKPYKQLLSERREKNTKKAEATAARGRAILSGSLGNAENPTRKKREQKINVKVLDAILRKTEYVEKDLQSEAEKLDALLSRWQRYRDPAASSGERKTEAGYLRWGGFDPDDPAQLAALQTARQAIDGQLRDILELRGPLRQKKFSTAKEHFPEEKRYVQWLRERRLANTEKAEDTIARCQATVARDLRSRGDYYRREDFQELEYMLRKTAYVERDLQTEGDKLNKLLEHWQQWQDAKTPDKEKHRHEDFIRWSGCDPDNALELEYLKVQLELVNVQRQHIASVRDALTQTAEQWRGANEEPRRQFEMASDQEQTLRHQLKDIRANRKKLGTIAYNCQCAAKRRTLKVTREDALEKAEYFRGKWAEALEKEKALRQQIRDVKQHKRQARQQIRSAPSQRRAH